MRRQFLVLKKGFFQIGIVLAILSALVVVPSKVCNAVAIDLSEITITYSNFQTRVGQTDDPNQDLATLSYKPYPDPSDPGYFLTLDPARNATETWGTNSFSTGNPASPGFAEDDADGNGVPDGNGPNLFLYSTNGVLGDDLPLSSVRNLGEVTILNAVIFGTNLADGTIEWSGVDKFDLSWSAYTNPAINGDPREEIMGTTTTFEIFTSVNVAEVGKSVDVFRLWVGNYQQRVDTDGDGVDDEGGGDPFYNDDPRIGTGPKPTGSSADYIDYAIKEKVFEPGGSLVGTISRINPLIATITEIETFEGGPLIRLEPIPEPTTIILLGIGLAGMAGCAVRQRLKNKKSN